MGNYLYDDYEAKMKVTNDVINDWNFYTKLTHNFVSPKKIYTFVRIIFISNKSPPYHTKFLQVFYNNLNILERNEYFHIVEELLSDLTNKLSFHESYNNFNVKLCDIKAKNLDRSKFNYGLVKPKKLALEHFFLYVNFHRNEFEKIKSQIKLIIKEIEIFPKKVENNEENIKKIEYEEQGKNGILNVTYIGEFVNNVKEGKGMIIKKSKTNGKTIFEYYGEFKNNLQNGLGLIKLENVQIEGKFIDDKLDGKVCFYSETDIIYYEYKNGLKDGRSIKLHKNGNIYTSNFKNDKISEEFSLYIKSINGFFTGKRKENDTFEGIMYNLEGSVKVGNFNNNFELIGEGYIYSNYTGFFATYDNGEITPSLLFTNTKDGTLYNGHCDDQGDLHGENIMILFYGNENEKGDLIIGNYVHGKKIGYGEYYWGNGDYEKKIYPNGWGIRYYAKKNYFMEGNLINGFPKGNGIFTYDGKRFSGNYLLNKERCLFLSDNGKAYSCSIIHTPRFNEAIATQFKTEANN